MQPPRPLATAFAGAATTAVLLRASSGVPATAGDLATVVVVALLLAMVAVLAPRLHPRLGAAASGLPLALAGVGVSVPVVLDLPGAGPFLGVLVLLSLVLGLRRAVRREASWVGPRETVAGILGMAALTWLVTALAQGGGPAVDQWVGVLLGAAALLGLGRFAGLLLPLALVPGGQPAGAWIADGPVPEGPDVVLISVDTLRADLAADMAAVQQLSGSAVVLDGQASSPWTLPSMATLLTGREPHHHGAGRSADGSFHGLDEGVQTLPTLLDAAGWDTAATIENPFVGSAFGLPHGVARLHEVAARPFALPKAPLSDRARPWEASLATALGLRDPLPDGAARHLAQVQDILADRRDRPLFLWVHLFEPHLPYHHAMDLDLPLGRRLGLATFVRQAEDQPAPADMKGMTLAYRNEVAVVDQALLDLYALLGPPPDRGRIVVLASDHGEEFGEHGGWEHGHSMYQELLAVPLVIGGIKGLEPGMAGLVDVVPTVLGALGLQAPGLDGRDLRHGPTRAVRSSAPLYAQPELRAVRAGDRKLIADAEGLHSYDLGRDPAELVPSQVVDPVVQAMLPPIFAPTDDTEEVDPETRSQLEALGYVE